MQNLQLISFSSMTLHCFLEFDRADSQAQAEDNGNAVFLTQASHLLKVN
jgi:hypothetical protein